MKILFLALLFVASLLSLSASASTVITPAPTPATPPTEISKDYLPIVSAVKEWENKQWKNQDKYWISRIDGYLESYAPKSSIKFYVEGGADKIDVTEDNGFFLIGTIIETNRNIAMREPGQFDQNRRAWLLEFTTPEDTSKNYKLVLNMYCKQKESLCATTYGFKTQMDKILPLFVR